MIRVSEQLKKRLGLTDADLSDLWIAAMGKCAICRTQEGTIVLDHDHKLNRFRGFLCSRCNWLLGVAHDSPALLDDAASYLRNQAA